LALPLFAGVDNDGFADAFISLAATKLRETRVEYVNKAFNSPRIQGRWFVGWRRVDFSRTLSAQYDALAPDIPPLLPPSGFCAEPCPLTPRPDLAGTHSRFEGRGIDAGLDVEIPLWKTRVVLEGSAGVSVLRGDLTTQYNSTTYVYVDDFGSILAPPYDEFDDILLIGDNAVPYLTFIDQLSLTSGLTSSSLSQTAAVYDLALGFRWRTPFERLEVYGGLRQSYYDNIAAEIRPRNVTFNVNSEGVPLFNFTDATRTEYSVAYEGFYGGVRFRLY
jgi:hypothetical protein